MYCARRENCTHRAARPTHQTLHRRRRVIAAAGSGRQPAPSFASQFFPRFPLINQAAGPSFGATTPTRTIVRLGGASPQPLPPANKGILRWPLQTTVDPGTLPLVCVGGLLLIRAPTGMGRHKLSLINNSRQAPLATPPAPSSPRLPPTGGGAPKAIGPRWAPPQPTLPSSPPHPHRRWGYRHRRPR